MERDDRQYLNDLRSNVGFVTICALNKTINKRITGKRIEWNRIHEKKLTKLFNEITPKKENNSRPKNIVHNYSSYELTAEEHHILTYGLDNHITTRLNENEIKTEFEAFFYGLTKQLSHLTVEERDELKTKLRRSCENYYNIKNTSKTHDVIKKLSRNRKITILKQDKGRGVVILDKTKYIEKCMNIIDTDKFIKLDNDNTKEIEEKVQKTLLKVKKAIGNEVYKEIYPSGSNPGKLYGTAKVHKVKLNEKDKAGKLPIRPIISNIGTATHKTARYLCKLLSPLAKSKYTVESTREFVTKVKKMKIPEGYKMISFDVVSLFTNVPLKHTIDIILRKIYKEKVITTKIKREQMRELLLLCTKEVPFTFNDEHYMQCDGVMMGSPLGALFANIFMCELENSIIPKLGNRIFNWTRYVDDTFACIKPEQEIIIQKELNRYHNNIKFTYELEDNDKIAFLDVLIRKTGKNEIETSVYRKETNTDIYMNWNSYAPSTWKIATLKSLIKRALLISSNDLLLKAELAYIKKVFTTHNDYPLRLVETIIENERNKHNKESINEDHFKETDNVEKEVPTITLNLPYAGDKGEHLISKLKKYVNNTVNKNTKVITLQPVYKATRLSTQFKLKDQTKIQHKHNVVYHARCPNRKCTSHYGGQTKCRMEKRASQHHGRDKNSHLALHAEKTKHKRVALDNFKIIGQGYRSDFTRRISESLFIKKLKPDLNIQKDSYRLSLFN